ncbi:hypothetical protein [Pseudarthrobacter oxydans]
MAHFSARETAHFSTIADTRRVDGDADETRQLIDVLLLLIYV